MDITNEEHIKFRKKIERQQVENIEYLEKEANHRKLIDEGKFSINIIWRDKTSILDMEFLSLLFDKIFFADFKQNFSVVKLNLNNVLNFHCLSEEQANRDYPKDKLWDNSTGRSNRKIVKILEYIESGQHLSPPVIDISSDNVLLFYDGNHRVALARFLELKEIPFVVRTINIERLKKICL